METIPGSSDLLAEGEALAVLLGAAHPLRDIEQTDTYEALGRILARDQTSPIAVPAADNSAMDGYAVRSADLQAAGETRLRVTQRIPAGRIGAQVAPGSAARIFTGAPIPPGADAVVMQEHCRCEGDEVFVAGPVTPGTNIRRAGEDVGAGAAVLEAGIRLRPQDLGLAASVGLARLPVFRRLRVAVFFTGDELVAPGEPLAPGKLYNSNRYTLKGLIDALGCEIIDLGTVADTLDATCAALQEAAPAADVIITSGGVSVGEEDHVKSAVARLGRLELWRIAIKPGKPLAFGRVGAIPFIGLPGNPVSLFITFCILARPFILKMQGRSELLPHCVSARAMFERPNPIGRREYLRARLAHAAAGANEVAIYPHQGSGVLTSTTWANCLAVIPENATVARGQMVDIIPYSELLS